MANGIDVALAVAALAFLFLAVTLWEWKRGDDERRLERLRKRGLA